MSLADAAVDQHDEWLLREIPTRLLVAELTRRRVESRRVERDEQEARRDEDWRKRHPRW